MQHAGPISQRTCTACAKVFASKQAFQRHMNPKKSKQPCPGRAGSGADARSGVSGTTPAVSAVSGQLTSTSPSPGASHVQGPLTSTSPGASHVQGPLTSTSPGASHVQGPLTSTSPGASHVQGPLTSTSSGHMQGQLTSTSTSRLALAPSSSDLTTAKSVLSKAPRNLLAGPLELDSTVDLVTNFESALGAARRITDGPASVSCAGAGTHKSRSARIYALQIRALLRLSFQDLDHTLDDTVNITSHSFHSSTHARFPFN
jgi:hypothetical protein